MAGNRNSDITYPNITQRWWLDEPIMAIFINQCHPGAHLSVLSLSRSDSNSCSYLPIRTSHRESLSSWNIRIAAIRVFLQCVSLDECYRIGTSISNAAGWSTQRSSTLGNCFGKSTPNSLGYSQCTSPIHAIIYELILTVRWRILTVRCGTV